MSLSTGNIAYLVMVVGAFLFFMVLMAYASWTSRGGRKLQDTAPAGLKSDSLKVHGDKLSHTMDVAL